MSYRTQAQMAEDQHLLTRITACAATQGLTDPHTWAWSHRWKLSAEPGWDAAYAYALAALNDNPGNDEGVITDGQILSAVQMILAPAEAPAEGE
jgi:hypothetical protein